MRAKAALILCAFCAACVARQRSATPGITAPSTTYGAEEVVRLAIRGDAAGDSTADTLYAPEALVVANARLRMRWPRLAGVMPGGRISVASASATLEGRFAWVLLDYRWFNPQTNQVTGGRATVVCVLREGGWKIVHLHSSQPLPWER